MRTQAAVARVRVASAAHAGGRAPSVHRPFGVETEPPSTLFPSLLGHFNPRQGMYDYAAELGLIRDGELPEVRMHGESICVLCRGGVKREGVDRSIDFFLF